MGRNRRTGRASPPSAMIQSIKTTFRIIDAVKEADQPTVTELAAQTGLVKSTVHKHLTTLLDEGYVMKDDNTYRLSTRFLTLGGYVREHQFKSNHIKNRIKRLAEDTDHVAHFAVEENNRAVILYRESGENDLPTRSHVGKRMYLHQTAYGKAIFAHLPEDRIAEIVDEWDFPVATEHTIKDRELLMEELAEVKDNGYAINDEESTRGLIAIGAPVFLGDGTIYGACSIAGPVREIKEKVIDQLLEVTKQLELEITYS